MSQRWVSDLERGIIKSPRPEVMYLLSVALNVPIADLYLAAFEGATSRDAKRMAELASKAAQIEAERDEEFVFRTNVADAKRLLRILQRIVFTPDRVAALEAILQAWASETPAPPPEAAAEVASAPSNQALSEKIERLSDEERRSLSIQIDNMLDPLLRQKNRLNPPVGARPAGKGA